MVVLSCVQLGKIGVVAVVAAVVVVVVAVVLAVVVVLAELLVFSLDSDMWIGCKSRCQAVKLTQPFCCADLPTPRGPVC